MVPLIFHRWYCFIIISMNHNLSEYPYLIIGFSITIIIMLLLDLGVLNKRNHLISDRKALIWSVIWIGLAMLFSLIIYEFAGIEKFAQFQSAYWIEKALSIDNLFVFFLVFKFFNVPLKSTHKVLFYGIIGAVIMRAFFIFVGVEIIKHTFLPSMLIFGKTITINYLLTIFGLFLVYAGIKSWFSNDDCKKEKNLSSSPGVKFVNLFFLVSKNYDEDRFFTWEEGKKLATPLLIVVAVIEFTDLMFAVDSIPAIFSIAPNDSMILYTSNIFAILGLRSLYFLLSKFINTFSKLKYGLAIILFFIGIKMIILPVYHIKSTHSLTFIALIIISFFFLSLTSKKKR